MTLEQVLAVMKVEAAHKTTVRLHTGDPCLYGAIREQMDALDAMGIPYDDTPGVSSFCGAAAALNAEYTLPGVSQTVIITRMEGRTPVPEKEGSSWPPCRPWGDHGDLPLHRPYRQGAAGASGRRSVHAATPAAVVYKATGRNKKSYAAPWERWPESTRAAGITKTALIVVGDFLGRNGTSAASCTTRPLPRSSARGQTSDPRLSCLYGKGTGAGAKAGRALPGSVARCGHGGPGLADWTARAVCTMRMP